uniref:Uncharacterized protein n=1 Tax=Glossina austeni TaxID=7395 RepID=A0A1A9VHG0_GLOAU
MNEFTAILLSGERIFHWKLYHHQHHHHHHHQHANEMMIARCRNSFVERPSEFCEQINDKKCPKVIEQNVSRVVNWLSDDSSVPWFCCSRCRYSYEYKFFKYRRQQKSQSQKLRVPLNEALKYWSK